MTELLPVDHQIILHYIRLGTRCVYIEIHQMLPFPNGSWNVIPCVKALQRLNHPTYNNMEPIHNSSYHTNTPHFSITLECNIIFILTDRSRLCWVSMRVVSRYPVCVCKSSQMANVYLYLCVVGLKHGQAVVPGSTIQGGRQITVVHEYLDWLRGSWQLVWHMTQGTQRSSPLIPGTLLGQLWKS